MTVKRHAMDKAKVWLLPVCPMPSAHLSQISDAVKRYSYLLGQTELFKHFVDIKVTWTVYVHLLAVLKHRTESTRPRVCRHVGRAT